MDFEDFKKHWEIFSKIDSEEKLAACKARFENHRLHAEDQNFFEPSKEDPTKNLGENYKQNFYSNIQLDQNNSDQIYFFREPSFEPKDVLIIERTSENCLLTYYMFMNDNWRKIYAERGIEIPENEIKKSSLNNFIGDKLFNLLECTFEEARPPNATVWVLDGVIYSLTKKINGTCKTVIKNSPDENSKSGKVIAILELLIANLLAPTDKTISNPEILIDELLGL